MILVFLLAVTATFRPAAPTVGDPIAIDFPAPVVLDASSEYEVVSRSGNRVVVRTFLPQPFALSGTIGGSTRFRNLVVPVNSVLAPADSLRPAALKPPHAPSAPRLPYALIAAAALAAAGVWAAVVWLARRDARVVPVVPALPPREQFRTAVESLLRDGSAKRWAALADATRTYLAATTPHLGAELTTHELLTRAGEHRAILTDVLRQGDLEKFSPWGAAPLDFETIARNALDELAPAPVVEVAA